MCDEQTPKDVCREASVTLKNTKLMHIPFFLIIQDKENNIVFEANLVFYSDRKWTTPSII